jgi:glycerol-3-phosphate acyltransferase PlsY
MLSLAVITILSYLVGSIPGSLWISKHFFRVDIRHHGSGNVGATNAFRILGWKAGLLTTIVDMGKGILAAGVIASIRLDGLPAGFGAWEVEMIVRLIAGVAAVAGHMFPLYAGFKGGKGVNTAAGALAAITPLTIVIVCVVFFVVLLQSRYVSLASIMAALSFPSVVAIRKFVFHVDAMDMSLLIFGGFLALVIVYAHRGNIRRLLDGTEKRILSFKPHGSRLENQ